MVTYVGNRCIMTPEGIWSSSKSYEALSVVSHQPTGDGYVSRRAVPTGIDISDDTYWVKMTDFNTQLSTIQAGVEKAEEDAAEALAGVADKISKTKIIVTKEELLALLENGYVVDAALIRQLYNELNGKTEASGAVVRKFGDIGHRDAGATIYANIVMQKISPEKCNIHISAAMTALTNTSSDIFKIFDMDKIKSLLGISSLNFSAASTRAVIQTVTGDSISPSSIGYGLYFSGNAIGRFYNAEGNYGVWPSNMSTVYHSGNFYYIDIFGASITAE